MAPTDNTEEHHPLSSAELEAIRDLIERDKRATWLWTSLRVWALWLAAILGGWAIGWEALGRLIKTLAGKGE